MQVQSVVVLGGGSAGFLAAITIKTKLPDLRVQVIRSKEIGIIGVGEGSTPTLPAHLHGYLGIDLARFYREAQPTWKIGIRLLWGTRPFFDFSFNPQCDTRYLKLSRNTAYYYGDDFTHGDVASSLMINDKAFVRQDNDIPLIGHNATYHLENEKFVEFLEAYALELGIEIVDVTVDAVEQNEHGIAGLKLASGTVVQGDLYIDCSGFRSVLLGHALREPYISFKSSLLCDRAVLGSWRRGADEPIKPYTTVETMNSGWCWQIEHEHHITRGYVHASDFVAVEEAERELREKNPRIGTTRVVPFTTGRYQRGWVKNVVAIGNACGFVEPLESTSLGVICADCQAVTESLRDSDRRLTPSYAAAYNNRNARSWDTIRQFLAIHYRYNTRLDTPFWRACRADVDIAGAAPIVEYYQQNGPSTMWRDSLIDPVDQFKYDGYLTMLIGQQVPYATKFEPSPEELAMWRQIQAHNRTRGETGMSVAEALAVIRLPNWHWDPNFYRQVYAHPSGS